MSSSRSPIEWTDATWNPVRGCSRVSEGCRHCYAERTAARFRGPGLPYEGLVRLGKQGPVWTGEVRLIKDALAEPLGWRKPQRIFVNSMSDLFHEALPDAAIDQVWAVMLLAYWHTFQVVTKRPERAARYLADPTLYNRVLRAADKIRLARQRCEHGPEGVRLDQVAISNPATHPPRWLWLLTSVENQATADERIPHLLRCPAAVRGVSYEPALGPVDFSRWLGRWYKCPECGAARDGIADDGNAYCSKCEHDDPLPLQPRLNWLIAGGESGPGARPPHPKWFRDARDQAQAARVAFFFKQWGKWGPDDSRVDERGRDPWPHQWIDSAGGLWEGLNGRNPVRMRRFGKRAAGRLLDGEEYSAFPQVEVSHG